LDPCARTRTLMSAHGSERRRRRRSEGAAAPAPAERGR
jgi:hypothetical protein